MFLYIIIIVIIIIIIIIDIYTHIYIYLYIYINIPMPAVEEERLRSKVEAVKVCLPGGQGAKHMHEQALVRVANMPGRLEGGGLFAPPARNPIGQARLFGAK